MTCLAKLDKRQQAILALIAANIIWGAASPIFKYALTNIQPFTLAFLRFALAAYLLAPFVTKKLEVKKKDWPTLLFLSLLGITINISFFFWGLKLAPAINAPIIATSGPLFLLAGSIFLLKEKPQKKIIFGTAVGFLGVLLIILRPIFEEGFDLAIVGNLCFVLATFGSVGHTILTKKIAPSYAPLTITFWSFLLGAVTFIPLVLFEIQEYGFLTGLALPGIVGLFFGVLLSSLVAYFCYHWAIKHLLAQEVGVFAYLDPLVAIVIAVPLLGEIPTPTYLVGSLFVFLGIFVAQGRIPYHPFGKWKED